MPLAYSFNIQKPSQLIDIMNDQGVYLPNEIGVHQLANIRFIMLTRRLREIPFDVVKIDDCWLIDQVFHQDLKQFLKTGDRLLIINKTMISDALQDIDIFKLILHSSIPFIVWVTWDPDTYLKNKALLQLCNNENAYIDAKSYLLQTNHDDISLYDHLAFIISNAIENPQMNLNDLLERIQWIARFPTLESNLRSVDDKTKLNVMKIQAQLLESKQRYLIKSQDLVITSVPNLIDIAYCCASAGYGIHLTEIILLWSAMKRLDDEIHCTEMKFWGKIFGLYCDYYIVQVQHDKEIPFDEVDILNRKSSRRSKHSIQSKDPQFRSELDIPSEPHGVGTNKYTYFVTNSPGLPWIKLPDVKPIMIQEARKVHHLFTGCLSSELQTFPSFSGQEKDYLRAQIARITATTHISPVGFYILNDIETEEDEEATRFPHESSERTVLLNPEYNNDPENDLRVESLADENLQEWVHSIPEILPQGRTSYWRLPTTESTRVSTVDEEEEVAFSQNNIQIPAPLLQPIGDDQLLYSDQSAWSIGLTMSIMKEYSLCYVQSNVWPGAFTLGNVKKHFNLYIGWGQKYEQFIPPQFPEIEYECVRDMKERADPTVEVEKIFEEAQRAMSQESVSEEYLSTFEDYDEVLPGEADEEDYEDAD